MLGITGGMNIWFIANVKDMRIGRRRLLEIVKDRFSNPYNGDLFAFMPIIFTPWRSNPWLKTAI